MQVILGLFLAYLQILLAANGWTYLNTSESCLATNENPCGPAYWSKVPGCAACGEASQSPIDLSQVSVDASLSGPVFSVVGSGCNTWQQFSNNNTFEITFLEGTQLMCSNLSLTYNGTQYFMLQTHFHSPSEHSIGGGYYSAEAHLVHRSSSGALLVIGLFLQESAESFTPSNNSYLNVFWDAAGANTIAGITTDVSNNPKALNPYSSFLPARQTHYVYNGSLTTPPCTESVQWLVYDQPIMISTDDLYIIRKAIAALPHTLVSDSGNNNRVPSRPLNGRSVKMFVGEGVCAVTSTVLVDSSSDDDCECNGGSSLTTVALSIAVVSLCIAVCSVVGLFVVWRQLKAWQAQAASSMTTSTANVMNSVEMTTKA